MAEAADFTADAMSDAFVEWLKGKDLIANGLSEAGARLLAEAFMAGVFAGAKSKLTSQPAAHVSQQAQADVARMWRDAFGTEP